MNYDKAKLIIWNPESYGASVVRDAALFILSSLDASEEDIGQASFFV